MTLRQTRQSLTPHDPLFDVKNGQTLVIGYGNTLRGDDGVGFQIAEAVHDMNWAGVKAVACHQLMPELAEAIAQASHVIFVDAAIAPPSAKPDITLIRLSPDESLPFTTHAATPQALLTLTKWLYGIIPNAYQITVPALNFEMGETLSSTTLVCRSLAIERLRVLCQQS